MLFRSKIWMRCEACTPLSSIVYGGDNMQIQRSLEMEEMFYDALRDEPRKPRQISQFDVNRCPLRAYYRRLGNAVPCDNELARALGSLHHEILEKLKGHVKEKWVHWNGILMRLDMFGEAPVEIKTTRAQPCGETPHDSYIEQVKSYCVATDKDHGFLIIVYLIEAVAEAYRLDFTPEELAAKANAMIYAKELIEQSLDAKDPSLLVATSPLYGWECGRCEYRDGCAKLKPAISTSTPPEEAKPAEVLASTPPEEAKPAPAPKEDPDGT
jgi:hypothetical protein